MKVIHRGTLPPELVAQATCPKCSTVIEVTESECGYYSSYKGDFLRSKEKCPVCEDHHFNFESSDFKPKVD